jgi:hypothetical protein
MHEEIVSLRADLLLISFLVSAAWLPDLLVHLGCIDGCTFHHGLLKEIDETLFE